MGDIDAYQLPDAKGYSALVRHLLGVSDEERQQRRDQILATSNKDFKWVESWRGEGGAGRGGREGGGRREGGSEGGRREGGSEGGRRGEGGEGRGLGRECGSVANVGRGGSGRERAVWGSR